MTPRDEKKAVWLAVLAALIIAAVYLPALPYPFTFDDRTNIVENLALRLEVLAREGAGFFFSGQIPSAANRPVANLSFALNLAAGGMRPEGFRFFNILIHGINILLAFFLFRRVLAPPGMPIPRDKRGILALAGAALWGALPLHTESVTYIVQRETSLSATFFLGSLLLLARWREGGEGDRRRMPLLAGACLCFLLSAGTKETGYLLPFAAALLLWFREGDGTPKERRPALWLMLAGALLAAAAAVWLKTDLLGWRHLDAHGGYGPWERVLTQPRVLLWYLSLILLPLPSRQVLDVDFPASAGLLSPPSTFAALLFWALVLLAAFRVRKRFPLWSLASLWFLVLSSMEASFLHLEMAYIHRTYLPSLFLPLAAVAAILHAAGKGAGRKIAAASGAAVFLLFLGMTWQRNLAFASAEALWSDTVRKSPGKERPRFNLGMSLQEKGDLAGAMVRYTEAARINPRYFRPYANMGVLAERSGDPATAVSMMEKAWQLEPRNGEVLYNLGRFRYMAGRKEEAEELLRQALEAPTLTGRGDAWWYLALIAGEKGDAEGARRAWDKAVGEFDRAGDTESARRARMRRDLAAGSGP